MKKLKNKKLPRRHNQAKPEALITGGAVGYSDQTADMLNTMLNAVIRNVNNEIIPKADIMPFATIFSIMVLHHYYPGVSKNEYCSILLQNWDDIISDLVRLGRVKHTIIVQSKTATLNDE